MRVQEQTRSDSFGYDAVWMRTADSEATPWRIIAAE